jgi:predicted ATPase with chaperone activity
METIQVEAPQAIGDTRISRTLLEELALKTLFLNGEMSLADLADRMCVSLAVVEEIFQFFRRELLCEVKGMVRGTHVIAASAMGKARAVDLLSFSQYAGPAPVSLEDYSARVHAQSVQQTLVQPDDLKRAFRNLVLDEDLLTRLGTAVVSGTSIFLYGPPGTGKTTLACNIPVIYEDSVLIPYAIEVDRQIIAVYDPGVHQRANEPMAEDWDHRWVLCHRPRVVTGGELSGELLDLQFNVNNRFFTAPLQLKANNGVLVIDDFGRQRMRPDELLNRWMTPLDRRIDFLTLPGGKKFEIPFDTLVVFSTNLDPRELADEAFLRRIPNKINVSYATPEQFEEIFRRECAARMLSCEAGVAEFVVELIAKEMKQPLSPSHVRDIVNQVFWSATYRGVEPRLTRATLEEACRNYFLPVAKV